VRRLLFALLSLTLAATSAGAQMRRGGLQFSQPDSWVSLGAALQNGFSVYDGTTGSRWDFSNATQYTASIERALSNGASIGLRGNTARVPLTYTDATVGSTDADANISQLFLSLYLTSGQSFHTVLEGDLGATLYSNFRQRSTGARLGPANPDADFAFVLGYGGGYAFSPRFSVDFVQTLTTSLHQKTGLSAGDDSSVRVGATRLIARFGLG
jgi:hypothetical protein